MKLEDYFDAYDKTNELSSASPDWQIARKGVNQALARPLKDLSWWGLFLIVTLLLGNLTDMYYMLALAALFVIPQYLRNLRKEHAILANLSDDEDLWVHLQMESAERVGNAFGSGVFWGILSLVFLATGVFFWNTGNNPVPAGVASSVFAGISAYLLLYRYPLEKRELEIINSWEPDGDFDGEVVGDGV